jgi:hypothetical protein
MTGKPLGITGSRRSDPSEPVSGKLCHITGIKANGLPLHR